MLVTRNTFCGDSVKARFWKEAPSSCSFCRRGHLVQFIEQENQPYSGVEWHFACLMRTKRRHRAGASAPQPPRTPLALLDELHKLAYVHVNTSPEFSVAEEPGVEIQALLTQHEYGRLLEYIEKNHIHAFMTAGNCSEIHGQWFKSSTQRHMKHLEKKEKA